MAGKLDFTPSEDEHKAKLDKLKELHPESYSAEYFMLYGRDEIGLAQLFSDVYENDTRFCPDANAWYTYTDGVWKSDRKGVLAAKKLMDFARLLTMYAMGISDEDKRTEYMKFCVKLTARSTREKVLKDASTKMLIAKTDFDKNPYLINCMDGTFDLEKMTFRPHNWQDFITMKTRFCYENAEEMPFTRWEKFVEEVTKEDKEKALYLQKAFGYSMLGRSNEECMFILYGRTTRNGKSTMLSAIQHALGDYATSTPVELICQTSKRGNGENATPQLAALQGTRFVTMAESNQNAKLDEEMIKQITGGEVIKARAMYEMPIAFVPQFTLWLSCNDLPNVSDSSLFASDRLRVITFDNHFNSKQQDRTLKESFQRPEAMRAIFRWMLAGYRKYKKDGLVMPAHMKAAVNEYAYDNDLVLQFLEQKCEQDADAESTFKSLFSEFCVWCRSAKLFAFSPKRFTAELVRHTEWVLGKEKRGADMYFKGVKLKGG